MKSNIAWCMKVLLLTVLSAFMLSIVSMPSFAEKLYIMELSVSDGEVLFSSLKIVESPLQQVSFATDTYALESMNDKGVATFRNSFKPPAFGAFSVWAPYDTATKNLRVIDPQGNELLKIPTMQFSNSCGNSECEAQESFESCPQDCPSGKADDYCDGKQDGKCDPDCDVKLDSDCGEKVEEVSRMVSEESREMPEDAVETKPEVLPGTEPDVTEDGMRVTVPIAREEEIESYEGGAASEFPWLIVASGVGIFIVLLVVVMVVAVVVRRPRKEDPLQAYVRQCLASGYSMEQIKQVLVQQGYSVQDAERAVLEGYQRTEAVERRE